MKILFIKSILIKSILRFACFILLFPLTLQITAQTKLPFDFVTTKWTEDSGLPQNSVNDIIQTKDGYIWLATFGGIARFDGIKFTVLNKFNSPGLVSDRILQLFEDNEGGIWIGTEDGLSYYKEGSFKTFTEKDGFSMYNNVEIHQDKNGTIWLFAFPDFYQFRDGRFYKQEITNDENLRKKASDGGADFFVPFTNKIYAVIDNKVINFFSEHNYPRIVFWEVIRDTNGTIWASTSSGLYQFQKNIIRRLTTKDGLLSDSISDLFIDDEGAIWVNGTKGINYFKGEKIYSVERGIGIPDVESKVAMQDQEGNYWFGTQKSGIFQIRKTIISNYGVNEGFKNYPILSICKSDDGSLLVGTNGGGIYELRNEKVSQSPLSSFILNKDIWSIFEDSQKRIWTFNNDLSYVDNNGSVFYPASHKFDLYNTKAIYEASDGAIWIGCEFGLLRYFKNTFTNYSTQQGLTETDVRCIQEDDKGNIWAGTVNGLFEISSGKVKSFSSIPGLKNYYFRAIYQDKDGVMWFGTYGGGLLRLKNYKFFVFSTDNGMIDNVVSHIIEDDNGYFWMGSNRGIQRIRRQELNDYADGKSTSFFVYNYDKSDGMISSETNGGFQPSEVDDANGNIYFPTISGVVKVHTNKLKTNKMIPPVHIGQVLVNGRERKLNDLQINYDSSNVEIYFDILSYTVPQKNRAKYIMEGYDNGWNDAGNLRYARYTSLPPGEYTFKVMGSNGDNVWNEQAASIPITVLPPFWMTWWSKVFIVLSFLSTGPIFYYRRVKKLEHEQKRQHEFSGKLISSQEQERSRIAQELHDSLGQELLLIKNRAMLGLKNYTGDDKVKKQLEYISDYSTNAISKVRQISHNLRPPELDRLGLTETIRSLLNEIKQTSVIKFNISIDEINGSIKKENEINLLRIIQESIVNIIKHADATEIKCNILKNNNAVIMSISDNGKGFNAEFNLAFETKGLGFSGMKERANILGGNISIVSAPGKGTKIILEIPIQNVD